jgi:membrane-associated protease RseP (regulator of RpoE activity)
MVAALTNTGYFVAALMLVAAIGLGRWLAARAVGIRGLPLHLGIQPRWSFATSSLGPWLLCAGCSVAAGYATAGCALGVGLSIRGADRTDEASMRVRVVGDSAAAAAGLRDGDRIDAVEGAPIRSWSELRRAISARPGERIDLAITREGQTLHLYPVPDARGRIGVSAPVEHGPARFEDVAKMTAFGPVLALGAGVKELGDTVRDMARPQMQDVQGPVGILRGSRSRPASEDARSLVLMLGGQCAYLLPIAAIVALVSTPRRRPRSRR